MLLRDRREPAKFSDVGSGILDGLCRKRNRMETDIERWLSFAVKVENKLQTMNNDTYSDRYIAGISNLLNELRHEAAIVKNASLLEKEDS